MMDHDKSPSNWERLEAKTWMGIQSPCNTMALPSPKSSYKKFLTPTPLLMALPFMSTVIKLQTCVLHKFA